MTSKTPAEVTLTGSERAAILLLSLGEAQAAAVLQHMDPKEVQKLGAAMAQMDGVSQAKAEMVINDFASAMRQQTSLGVSSEDYIRNTLVAALGEDKAGRVIDRILIGKNSKGLESLKWMDARGIADLIRGEHPQIIAIVLAYLDSDQAAAVLPLLPERDRPDVVMRIAALDGIQARALVELDEIIERQFNGSNGSKASSVGGVKAAANIMNNLDSTSEQAVMAAIRERNAKMSTDIEELMFVFDNLGELDDRSLQRLMRDVSNDQLTVALRGASAELQETFFRNMSSRAAEMVREDMEVRGPVRLADVDTAQKEILAIARKLGESGDIQLGSSNEEFV
ncbi:MAG: flagellar motor switch protein FliG [Oceanococcaceae bacterium]